MSQPTVLTWDQANEALLGPGGPFETEEATVLGENLKVYKNRPRSLREVMENSRVHGDAEYTVFITEDGERRPFTFASLERTAASIAAGLRDRFGVGPGDRVAILAANCPEWVATFWACASMGAVVVACNGWWTRDEIEYALDLTEPKLLIADRRRMDRLGDGNSRVPSLVIEDDFAETLWNHAPGSSLPEGPIEEDAPVTLLFTSGTTGRPKAAVISHRSMIAFYMTSFFLGARDSMSSPAKPKRERPFVRLSVFPLFHVSGMQGSTVTSMASGMKTVWPMGRFDAEKVIALTPKEGITAWTGASTHLFRLLEHPSLDNFDVTMIESLGVGGSASTPELIRATEAKFPHTENTFSSGYGSTESGALISFANTAMLKTAADCVGPPLPTVEVRILDEDGRDLPDGEDGNIWFRSPLAMNGYWNNDEANAENIKPGRWIKTGDFGRMQDGFLYLAARKRDLILRGGENVYPIEIENRLEAHPNIAEAAVHGVDHRTLGQEVKAVVVPRPGAELDPEAIRTFCAETLAYYKVPAIVEVRSTPLPRNATGKVMKHVLTGDAESSMVEE
ncbi:acyl--CoA ligase [Myxococcota bacterium]|nr:acyl--CoA ligase [Myxococcota bacterium]